MYFVQCPKCQQRMKVKQELHKVKVRCAHCKEVFVAETEEVSDSPAPAGTKPAAAASRPANPRPAAPASKPKAPKPQPEVEEPVGIDLDSFAPAKPATPGAPGAEAKAPRVLRKKSNLPMIVVIAGGVLCIVFICLVVWLNLTKVVQMPDGTRVRMSNSEAADWQAKQLAEANAPPAPEISAAAAAANTAAHASPGHHAPASASAPTNPFDDMPPGEGPNDITADNAKAMEQLAEMDPKYKDKLQLSKNTIFPDDQDPKSGIVAVELQNTSDKKTIKTLVLAFQIMNKVNGVDRVVGHTTPVKLEYFPPTPASMKYSVTYELYAVGKYLKPIVSQLVYAPDNTVSWMVLDGFQMDNANGVVKVTGHAKNETGVIVRDPMVYATFFNGRGEVLGSSDPVKLEDKTTLLKDADARFVVRFDKHKSIEEAKAVDIRVVGKKD